jgi:hypothetical protein
MSIQNKLVHTRPGGRGGWRGLGGGISTTFFAEWRARAPVFLLQNDERGII